VTADAAGAGLADDIEAALGAVSVQLQAGDVVAAAAAIKDLVASCQGIVGGIVGGGGQRLNDAQVTRLRAMLDQCTTLASVAQDELNVAMQQFGVGGRARKAYGDY
jgi:uncharacterized protein YbjQ (UPF0145 family)